MMDLAAKMLGFHFLICLSSTAQIVHSNDQQKEYQGESDANDVYVEYAAKGVES